MASEALGHDQATVPSEDMEEREEEEVPLRRKRSVYRRARTEFHTPAFAQFQTPLSADVLSPAAVSESAGPSIKDAQARKRFEEEQASERLVQRLRAEDLAQEYMPNVSEERAKELDELMMRMTETDWLNLMMQVGSNPALARELLGADVTEENFVERMTAIKDKKKRALADLRYRALKGKPMKQSEVTQMMRTLVKNQWCAAHNGTISMTAVKAMSKQQLIEEYENICRRLEKDRFSNGFCGSHRESGVSPFADSADSSSPSPVSIYISGAGVVVVDKLPDDEIVDPRVKVETVSDYASSPPRTRRKHRGVRSDDFQWDKPVEDFFSSESESDDDLEHYIPPLPYGAFKDWEIVRCPLSTTYYHVYYQENRRQKSFFYLKQLLPHVYREDLLLLRRRMNRYFRLNPDVDVGLDLWRDVNLLCQSLHSDDVEDFWRTQDDWIVSSWKLYPKSSVHVLDLTNGKTVYMFIDRTVQAGLRESYECLASVPMCCINLGVSACMHDKWFSANWLQQQRKKSGSIIQEDGFGCGSCRSEDSGAVESVRSVRSLGNWTFSNPLSGCRLPKNDVSLSIFFEWKSELASPEQNGTGKIVSNPLYGCAVCKKLLGIPIQPLLIKILTYVAAKPGCCCSLMLLLILFCCCIEGHAVSFDAAVASPVPLVVGLMPSAAYLFLCSHSSCSREGSI
ncbi:hypothetical protein Tco_0209050 [Tanacetum coccineum]